MSHSLAWIRDQALKRNKDWFTLSVSSSPVVFSSCSHLGMFPGFRTKFNSLYASKTRGPPPPLISVREDLLQLNFLGSIALSCSSMYNRLQCFSTSTFYNSSYLFLLTKYFRLFVLYPSGAGPEEESIKTPGNWEGLSRIGNSLMRRTLPDPTFSLQPFFLPLSLLLTVFRVYLLE